MEVNLSILDGFRCLSCLWIIVFHQHAFSGGFGFLTNSSCMKYVSSFPVLGFFTNSPLAVEVFWILSAFLCEFQLQKLYEKSSKTKPTITNYLFFFINRLFRIYPLYLLLNLFSFLVFPSCGVYDLVISILFLDIFNLNNGIAPRCSSHGWSVNIDMHGYLLILLSFGFFMTVFSDKKFARFLKKWFMRLLFLAFFFNFLIKYKNFTKNMPEGTSTVFDMGIEIIDKKMMDEMNMTEKIVNFYPNFEELYNEKENQREFINEYQGTLYYSSIDLHGGIMLLGSLLAMDVLERKGKQSYPIPKIILGLLFMILVIMYERIGYFLGLAVYFWLDVLLCMDVSNFPNFLIFKILSNNVWKFLSSYTYGIYVAHIFVILGMNAGASWVADKENGGVGCDGYGYLFLLKNAMIVLAISLFVSVLLQFTLEFPFNWIRFKYVRPYYQIRKENVKVEKKE